MSWISKLVTGNPDEFSHAKLVKYGIGEHPGPRAFLKISKNSITFKADIDMEKIFIRGYVKGVPEGSQKIKGLIVSYNDRRDELSNMTMPTRISSASPSKKLMTTVRVIKSGSFFSMLPELSKAKITS